MLYAIGLFHVQFQKTVNGVCKCRRPGKQLRDETWEKLYYLGQASGCKNNGHVASTITVAFKRRNFYGRTGTGGEEEACWDVKTLCEKGRWQEAVELLLNNQVVRVDSHAYASVLQACTKMKALAQGKQIHAHLLKRKWHLDIFLGNNLLNMYTQCGSLPDACKLFDEMQKRNIDTWNAMIRGFAEQGHFEDALTVLLQMQREKVLPSRYTFMSLVNGCARLRTLEKGKHVHALSIKAGLASDTWVGNALIDMYAKCGSVEDARGVFDGMQKRDVVSWNAMIAGYSRQNLHEDAFSLFDEMQTAGIVPTKFTMTSILGACCSPAALEQGKQIHACCSEAGFESDIRVGTALVSMYAKCGSVVDAKKVFDKMPTRNTFSWTAMIRAYAQEGYGAKALELFVQMKQEGVMPDRVLFLSILNAIASPGALQIGRQIHAQVIEAGLESDLPVANALISMYAKCGSMEDAHRIFDSMPQRNVVSWTAMISGYAQQNHSKAAIEVFSQMQREGVKPDRVTFISILDACANLAALQKGKSIHAQILKAGLDSDNGVEIALVNMYAKCGSLVHADQVFDKMLQRDVVVWTVMIVGYAQHGRGKEAIQLFEWMKQEGVKPDSLTFTGLLTACSHVGLVEEGRCYFRSITQDYGITPAMQHYGSMVDLLGRAGRLDEAADFIEKMPFEADASVWGALLGACKIHCNVELAECAAKRLLVLDPDNGSWYVLLSNIYAAAGMSDKAQYMRKSMKKRGAMKDPGPSWVEVDNEVHLFVAEDRSHQYKGEINEIGQADEKDERERIYTS